MDQHNPTIAQMARSALDKPAVRDQATNATDLFRAYCAQPMPRIPGCDTVIRIAIRIDRGMTPDESAAREYVYRWSLFLRGWINHVESRSRSRWIHSAMCYPAPHLIGQ